MTTEPTTFHWIEIENFRGFQERRRLFLDGSAVILTGPNGSGKTSFFDAIQWLLLGSLERFEPWRHGRRKPDHIVNRYASGRSAAVTAELEIDGDRYVARREGTHEGSELDVTGAGSSWSGAEADRFLSDQLTPALGTSLSTCLMTSALLQQDVVRSVLEDKPRERYTHLAGLLGIEQVAQFDAAARGRAERLSRVARAARDQLSEAESELRAAQMREAELQGQLAQSKDVAEPLGKIKERLAGLAPGLVVNLDVPQNVRDAAELHASGRDCRQAFESLRAELRELLDREKAIPAVNPQELDRLRRQVADLTMGAQRASQEARVLQQRYEEASRRNDDLVALAERAIPLLGDSCPVCGQEINAEHVAGHLRARLNNADTDLPRLRREAEAGAVSARELAVGLEKASDELKALEAADASRAEVLRHRSRWEARVQDGLSQAQSSGLLFAHLESTAPALGDEDLRDAISAAASVENAGDDLAILLRGTTIGGQLSELQRELDKHARETERFRRAATKASKGAEDAKQLQRASTRAAAAVTKSRFERLAPLASNIYARLDPHPTFKSFDFLLGVYSERGVANAIVRDEVEDVSADPLIVLSSSQANAAALSYFLALSWASGPEALKFVLLDDPLQSMDDINALGFADLCRHLRRSRQLVISTHERRLALLLERKLAARVEGEQTRVLDFQGWSRSGPEIDSRTVEPELREGEQRLLVET
jgi:DNA repair exonuclease SbcCD ATPase subunit